MYLYPKALSRMPQLSCCLRLEAGQSSPPSLPWKCFSQRGSPLHPRGASSCSQHGAKPAQQHGKHGEGTGGLLNVGAYITRGISLGSPHRRDGANDCIYPPAPAQILPLSHSRTLSSCFARGSGRRWRLVPNALLHLVFEDHGEMQTGPVHVTCPFSIFCVHV